MSLFDAAILQDFDVALRSTSKLSDQAHGKRAPVVGDKHVEADKAFAGSIPENYDRLMVPLIFEPYAADMAQRKQRHFFERLVLKI